MKKVLFALLLGVSLIALSVYFTKKEVDKQPEVNKESASLVDGTYIISTSASSVNWGATKITGAGHTGKVNIKEGKLSIVNSDLKDGNLILDMKSISSDENISSLIKHLNSQDFFDTQTYPEAKLVITSVNKNEETGIYNATGDLTIKGKTAPINFDILLEEKDSKILAFSELKIDRTTWDIRFGSGKFFQDLGNNMIQDEIELTINLEATK